MREKLLMTQCWQRNDPREGSLSLQGTPKTRALLPGLPKPHRQVEIGSAQTMIISSTSLGGNFPGVPADWSGTPTHPRTQSH